jgi:hypothetical protein
MKPRTEDMLQRDISQQPRDREPNTLTYERPGVRDLGSLKDLTLGGMSVGSDSLGGVDTGS